MVKSLMCCFMVDLSVWEKCVKRGQGAGIPVRHVYEFEFDFFHQGHSMVFGDSECMQTQVTDRGNPS